MSNAHKNDIHKAKPLEEFVTTQHGSGPFRAFNFELYAVGSKRSCCKCMVTEFNHALGMQRPTGFMRLMAYAGTTAFVGIMGYLIFEKNKVESKSHASRRARGSA